MRRLLVAAVVVVPLIVAGGTSFSAQAADRLLKSELSLGGYTATVSFLPALSADDPAHQELVSSPGTSDARVRIGAIEANAALRIGSVELPRSEGSNSRHDLWLKGSGADWGLVLTRAESTSERPVAVGEVLLVRKAAAKSPHLTLALVPELGSTGRLLVRWENSRRPATSWLPHRRDRSVRPRILGRTRR